jgi:hypothetical protein
MNEVFDVGRGLFVWLRGALPGIHTVFLAHLSTSPRPIH